MRKKYDSIAIVFIGCKKGRARALAKHKLVVSTFQKNWKKKLTDWLQLQHKFERRIKISLVCNPTKERIDIETRFGEELGADVVVLPLKQGDYSNISIGVRPGRYEFVSRFKQ